VTAAYLDAHVHLTDPAFDSDREGVLERAADNGVTGFVLAGTDPADWRRQRELARPGWRLAFGFHPWWAAAADDAARDLALAELGRDVPRASAVGEIGLDHAPRMDSAARARQCTAFVAQLALAKAHAKPIVLHVVRAHAEVLALLAAHGARWSGLVHGFNAGSDIGARYLALGLDLSLGAAAIAPGRRLARALDELPRDRFAIESDAPSGLPEPARVWDIARALGARWGDLPERVLERASARVRDTFGEGWAR